MKTLVLIFCLGLSSFNSLGEFRAGIAVRKVNPDPLLPVSGGVGPSNPVREQVGDLTVRALVLEQEGTIVGMVSADFLGFPGGLCERVRTRVESIPAQNILIGATHTHSAPDCYGFPDGKGGTARDEKYIARVCAEMAGALREAVEKLQPARLRIATGEAKGKIAYNAYAEELYDPRCHVLQAVDASGRPIATLVNYAIHPEVLGSRAGVCSPDLVGPLYTRLAARGGGTGIFLNSAQGGMVTADNRLPDGQDAQNWEECERIGYLLADEALRIIEDAPEQKEPKLFCAARTITLPVDSAPMRGLLKVLPESPGPDATEIKARINLVNVGNAQILTIPGEALPNIGYYLKRKMRGEHNLLFGLTNDALGYILTKEDYDSFKRYAYITRTSLGERTGEILVSEAQRLIEDCPPPQKH